MPMLVRAVCYRATPLDTLVDKALAGATKGVHAIGPATPAPAESSAASADCLPALPCDAELVQKAGPAGL
jgi:PTS system ascorbate-specific IIA component